MTDHEKDVKIMNGVTACWELFYLFRMVTLVQKFFSRKFLITGCNFLIFLLISYLKPIGI